LKPQFRNYINIAYNRFLCGNPQQRKMETNRSKYRIGLGVCGGIAAYKAIEVLRGLQRADCEVRVCMTRHATEFIQPLTFRALTNNYVLVDDYDRDNPDPIAHINFSQTIDLFIVVPATANFLAKLAHGIADDFLTSTCLASTCPILIAPAMNSEMWNKPATQRNLQTLRGDGVIFVEPATGRLACETVGIGKLEDVDVIVESALRLLKSKFQISNSKLDLKGEKILVTTGGTREEIDPVRFISNHSSGKMGFSVAEMAANRGAEVTVVAGATSVEPPENVKVIRATSADSMHHAVMANIANATVYIGAAAVADYRPKNRAESKIKKNNDEMIIELEKTTDILADVSKNRHEGLIVVGFAAETNDVETYARSKMERKNLDMIIANDVSNKDTGFGSENNQALIFVRNVEKPIEVPLMSKREMADKILDVVIRFRKKI
jgi:phosphopantothenoylcysteine decarboxylase / phosphopantothenate---cysteine ligase